MTINQVKEIVNGLGLHDHYQLRTDNYIWTHTKEYPIGYFKTADGAEFAVAIAPNILQTSNWMDSTKKHFSISVIPMESVEQIEFKPTKEDAPQSFNYLKLTGAFTEDEVNKFISNKDLFGDY